MPAAAVIPARRAYINVVAVKKPVVGFEDLVCGTAPHTPSGVLWITAPHIDKVLRHVGTSTVGVS